MVNSYSQTWYKLFLETQLFTEQEVAFMMRNLPNPPYRRILDVGCGPGRHTLPLAKNGYAVVGIDVDETAVSTARKNAVGDATFFRQAV